MRANRGNNRKVGVTGNVSWGEFWNGQRGGAAADSTSGRTITSISTLNYSRNHVTLPSGEFTTQLLGARLLYGFSPRLFFNAFLRYNADTHQVSSNLRFNFTHHPLSDIYIVYNDRRDTTGGQLVERALHRQGHEPVQFLKQGGADEDQDCAAYRRGFVALLMSWRCGRRRRRSRERW